MPSSPRIEPEPSPSSKKEEAEAFIARWTDKDGGERSNYQLFIKTRIRELGEASMRTGNPGSRLTPT